MQSYPDILSTDLLSNSRVNLTDRDDAAASGFLGLNEPAVMWAGQTWVDTTLSLIKVRNATNLAWITIGTFATDMGHMLKSVYDPAGHNEAFYSASNRQASITTAEISAIDTDGTLAANSDSKIATQKATKTYGGVVSAAAASAARANSALEIKVEARTDDPAGPAAGRVWLRTDL